MNIMETLVEEAKGTVVKENDEKTPQDPPIPPLLNLHMEILK